MSDDTTNVVELPRKPRKRGNGARKGIAKAKPPLPWERQPDETRPAFDAFAKYRDMGSERSLKRLSQDHKKSIATVSAWSAKHDWQRRVTLYDDDLDRCRREASAEAIEQMAARQARDLSSIADVVGAPARELAKRLIAEPQLLARLSNADLIKISLAAGKVYPQLVQAERLVRGLSTERPEVGRRVGDSEVIEYLAGADDGSGEAVARVGVVVNGNAKQLTEGGS